jgi:hypothetical protein
MRICLQSGILVGLCASRAPVMSGKTLDLNLNLILFQNSGLSFLVFIYEFVDGVVYVPRTSFFEK